MPQTPHSPEQRDEERTTFQSLPPEVRDSIYMLALVASSPIIVWSPELRSTDSEEQEGSACSEKRPYFGLPDFPLGLLRCNRTIALEAASTFYGRNTFSFLGSHEWIPIICWLRTIGRLNRSFLTRLEASVQRLPTVWQYPDGTRVRMNSRQKMEIYPLNPQLSLLDVVPDGEVENINPSIETIFAMLGQCETGPRLVLTLNLRFYLIPGFADLYAPAVYEQSYFSMDLPNLVEKWCVDYTKGVGCRPVEVLWKAETYWKFSIKNSAAMREKITDQGWEILEEKQSVWSRPTYFELPACPPHRTTKFTLRRKPLTGPLVASEPSPWSLRMGPEP